MSYTINRFNGAELTVVTDATVDETLNIKLIGKNYAGYGEMQNENFVYLLENFAGKSQPSRPLSGQLWYDTDNNRLKFYDVSSQFRSLAGINVQAGSPTGAGSSVGEFWYDSTNSQLHAWNGSKYTLIGPQGDDVGGTVIRARLVYALAGGPYYVLEATVDSKSVFLVSNHGAFTLVPASDTKNTGLGEYNNSIIRPGINLAGTNSLGVTDSSYNWRFSGTATDSERLGGYLSSNLPVVDTVVLRNDAGAITATNGIFSGTYIKLPTGTPTNPEGGMLRYNSGQFLGFNGTDWLDLGEIGQQGTFSLVGGGGSSPSITLSGGSGNPITFAVDTGSSVTLSQSGNLITIGGGGGSGGAYSLAISNASGSSAQLLLMNGSSIATTIQLSGTNITFGGSGTDLQIIGDPGQGGGSVTGVSTNIPGLIFNTPGTTPLLTLNLAAPPAEWGTLPYLDGTPAGVYISGNSTAGSVGIGFRNSRSGGGTGYIGVGSGLGLNSTTVVLTARSVTPVVGSSDYSTVFRVNSTTANLGTLFSGIAVSKVVNYSELFTNRPNDPSNTGTGLLITHNSSGTTPFKGYIGCTASALQLVSPSMSANVSTANGALGFKLFINSATKFVFDDKGIHHGSAEGDEYQVTFNSAINTGSNNNTVRGILIQGNSAVSGTDSARDNFGGIIFGNQKFTNSDPTTYGFIGCTAAATSIISDKKVNIASGNGSDVAVATTTRLSVTTAGIVVTGTINGQTIGSDIRLKDVTGKIQNPLEKISQLTGYHFKFNKLGLEYGLPEGPQLGLTAQDVKAILPELVVNLHLKNNEFDNSKVEDPYLGVLYDKLVPLLVEGIKEQTNTINSLTDRVTQLEQLVKKLVA
jgi:hypothetical protein